jgi:hypothetical protein
MKQRVYLVATNDRDLKRRVRKVPGVPILSVARGKYVIERYVSLGRKTLRCATPVHWTTSRWCVYGC